jgi:hypothetical protein
MVGIYNKIKNGLNWIKGKAAKYIAPIVSGFGDFASSDFVKGAARLLTPALDMAIPGLGTGINKGLEWAGKAGDVAKGLSEDYKTQGDNFGFVDMFNNVRSGKYTKKSPGGINLAKKPTDLHPRIELKSIISGDDEYGEIKSASFVEEID